MNVVLKDGVSEISIKGKNVNGDYKVEIRGVKVGNIV